MLVSVVWPAIALLWQGVGEYIIDLGTDKVLLVIYGYGTIFLLQTLIKEIIETFIELNKCQDDPSVPCNEMYRIFAENVYIFLATTVTILIWQGQSNSLVRVSKAQKTEHLPNLLILAHL